jgi:hypothetical protein
MLRRNIAGIGFLDQSSTPSGGAAPVAALPPAGSGDIYTAQAQADSQALLQAYSGASAITNGGQGAAANGAQILSVAGGGIGTALLVTGAIVGVGWLAGAFRNDDDYEDDDYYYYEDDDEDPDGESAVSGLMSGMGTTGTVLLVGGALLAFYLWNSSQTPATPVAAPAQIPGASAVTPIYQAIKNAL